MKKQEEDIALSIAIGRTIAKRRNERSMTQNQLAEKLGVGYEAVSRMERGNIMPTIGKLIKLAEVFECPIDELLFETSSRAGEQAHVILRMIDKLKPEDRKFMIEVVDKLSGRLQK